MQFNVNRHVVNMLELFVKHAELRRLVYVIASMVWIVGLIHAIRWW